MIRNIPISEDLFNEACELDYDPQPWWDDEFAEWAIGTRRIEIDNRTYTPREKGEYE